MIISQGQWARPHLINRLICLHDCTDHQHNGFWPDDEIVLPPRCSRDYRRPSQLTDCAQTSSLPSLSITAVIPFETSFAAKLQNIDPLPSLARRHGPPAQILSTKTTRSPCSICRSHPSLPKSTAHARIGGKRHLTHTTSEKDPSARTLAEERIIPTQHGRVFNIIRRIHTRNTSNIDRDNSIEG